MGWLIDPQEQPIFVYLPNQLSEVFDDQEAILPTPIFASNLQLSIRDLLR